MKALAAFLVILTVVGVLLSPLVVIWSLNTLFPALAIPFNWYTYVAMTSLLSTVKGVSSVKVKVDGK
jgi:hypothetical protein